MAWDDKSGNKGNPWGKASSNDSGRKPNNGAGGGGSEPPDLDEMLRKAQDNFKNMLPNNFKGGMALFGVLGAILLLWLSSGLYVVNPGENAVIQRFGQWVDTKTEPGLGYHLPAPIETATIVNNAEIRRLNIGFVDALTRDGNAARRSIPEESLMLTADRNIVDLFLVIQWNIKSSEDFIFNIKDQESTIKKVAESAIREVVGQTNMFPIITRDREEVASRARSIIQQNLDEYNSGVNITQVLIERSEVHPDVQDAFQDVQSAKQDAEDVQNRAGAYREDIIPRARGMAIQILQEAEAYKQSTIARSTGDSDRFRSVYEAYLQGKDVTKERMYIEAMEEVLSNASKIIMDDQGGNGVVPYLPLNELAGGAASAPRRANQIAPAAGQETRQQPERAQSGVQRSMQ
ncbi:MAG: FtsH protease activity modulator HflK [Alphaproteobacteria bacterium]